MILDQPLSVQDSQHHIAAPPLLLVETQGAYVRPSLTAASSGAIRDYFCCNAAGLNYLALRRRLFAQDARDLGVLLRLVQHEYELPWDEPRDISEDEVQLFSYIMGRNLLANHFARLGATIPYLGECVTVGSSVVTIIERAAVVCIDFVDPKTPQDHVEAVVAALFDNLDLSEMAKELVLLCSKADLITTISPLKTKRAYNMAKHKALLLADHLWSDFWPQAEADLHKERFEERGLRFPSQEEPGKRPFSGKIECTESKGMRKKIEFCAAPRLQELRLQWKKGLLKADIEKILRSHQVWMGRLLDKELSSITVCVKKASAEPHIHFRRAVASWESGKMVTLFRDIQTALDPTTEEDKKDSIIEMYAYLLDQDIIREDYAEDSQYVPYFAKRIKVPARGVVYILPEARVVVLPCFDDPTHKSISNLLSECVRDPSFPEELKGLLEHWEESVSILTINRETSNAAWDATPDTGLLSVWWNLDNYANDHRFHPFEFYKIASQHVLKTRVCLEHSECVAGLLCMDIADGVYGRLMMNLRDPICRWMGKDVDEGRAFEFTFPRQWVETGQKSRFRSDPATGDLKVCISFEHVKETIEEFLYAFDCDDEIKTRSDPLFPIFHDEILDYCRNIFSAFFRPEQQLIELYEKHTGDNVLCDCLEEAVLETFYWLDLKENSFYSSEMDEIRSVLSSEEEPGVAFPKD